MAHVSLLILICTVFTSTYISPGVESNSYFIGTHSIGSDVPAHYLI